jgi:hypothetical protein
MSTFFVFHFESSITDHVDALIQDLQILSESKAIKISAPKSSKKKRVPEKKKAAKPVSEAEASPAAPEEKEGTISAFHQEGKMKMKTNKRSKSL